MKTHYVYALIDPRNGVAFYIGQTTNLKNRFRHHMCKGRQGEGLPAHKVMHEIINSGYDPEVEVRDQITTTHKILVLKLEDWWKQKELLSGALLCNERNDAVCRAYTDFDTYPSSLKALAVSNDEDVEEFINDEFDKAFQYAAGLRTYPG